MMVITTTRMVMVTAVTGSQMMVLVRVTNVSSRIQRNARAARREEKNRQASNTADSQTPDYADMILALWTHNARHSSIKHVQCRKDLGESPNMA